VAAELSLRGWLATPTIKNAPGTDVLAQYREEGILVAIQTKTASMGNQFMLNARRLLPSPGRSCPYRKICAERRSSCTTSRICPKAL
jgi:hypothetical protein